MTTRTATGPRKETSDSKQAGGRLGGELHRPWQRLLRWRGRCRLGDCRGRARRKRKSRSVNAMKLIRY